MDEGLLCFLRFEVREARVVTGNSGSQPSALFQHWGRSASVSYDPFERTAEMEGWIHTLVGLKPNTLPCTQASTQPLTERRDLNPAFSCSIDILFTFLTSPRYFSLGTSPLYAEKKKKR